MADSTSFTLENVPVPENSGIKWLSTAMRPVSASRTESAAMAFKLVPPPRSTVSELTVGINKAAINNGFGKKSIQKNPRAENIESVNTGNNNTIPANMNDIIDAIEALPTLVLLINPSTMDFALSKIRTEGQMTRTRKYKIEHWGENLDEIKISGQTGGFVCVDPDGSGGLTRLHRSGSAAWRNLQSLIAIYRSNGNVYVDGSVPSNNSAGDSRIPYKIGYVNMFYDGVMYSGRFSEFQINETADMPHVVDYSASFTVHRTTRLDQSVKVPNSFKTTGIGNTLNELGNIIGNGVIAVGGI